MRNNNQQSNRSRIIVNDDRYRQAELLLDRRVSEVAPRLTDRLEMVRHRYDLSWSSLLQTQRCIEQAVGNGTEQPSLWLYWEETAYPRSVPLLEHALEVINQEMTVLGDAVSRFTLTARRLEGIEPAIMVDSIERALTEVRRVGIDPSTLNEIGQRWQKRLRRAAIRRAAVRILTKETREANLHIMQAEMELLASAPWAHLDRLLMAFELAHSDIRSHFGDRLSSLTELPNATRTHTERQQLPSPVR